MIIREMEEHDVFCGFMDCLETLGPVGLRTSDALRVFDDRKAAGIVTLIAWEKENSGWVVAGTASLVLERKFLHEGCRVGHVEDVAVLARFQRQGIGRALMEACLARARHEGCRKVLLSSSHVNEGFYKAMGFRRHEIALRFDGSSLQQ